MKKILYMLLLVQGGLMAQTKTFVTVNGEKVQINPNSLNTADNGLTEASGKVQLGGALLKPTSLITTSAYTLAIEGLQLGGSTDKILVADANGVLKWIDRSSLPGDNLGNHTATQDLNMSSKNITNINNAYVKNDLQILDRVAGNTNYFSLYKNNGIFGIWNNSKSGNDLQIDEATRKTGVNNLSISKGTDGVAPVAGSLATSLDANGNVVWKSPASVIAANQAQADWNMAITTDPSYIKNKPAIPVITGAETKITAGANITVTGTGAAATPYVITAASTADNLGNHTATQDLNMSSRNITAANDITAAGTVTAANVTASTKATAQTVAITKGTDGSTPAAGSIATAADSAGNLIWKDPSAVVASKAWTLLGNAGTNPSTNFLGTTDAQDLAIRTNNTEKMRLTNGGTLGIGTSTPNSSARIHVVGGSLIAARDTNPNNMLSNSANDIAASVGTSEVGILRLVNTSANAANNTALLSFNSYNGGGADWGIGTINNSTAAHDVNFFIGYSSGGGYYKRFNILNNGNVGIGTTAPTNTLHITSSSNPVRFEGLQPSITPTTDLVVVADATGVLKTVASTSVASTLNIVRKTANYTIVPATDNVILADATSSNITVTIPSGIVMGRTFTIKRVDSSANTVTIAFAGASATVDETDTSISVGNKVTYQIITAGSDKWQTISRF